MNMSIDFYNARQAYKMAEQAYQDQREIAKEALIDLLPEHGEGMTAAELSEQCGLESIDIAQLLSNFQHGKKCVVKTYVLLKDDGTIDYSHKIAKTYRANIYCRF